MNRKSISRRTILHGLGAAISLPLLEAMLPKGAAGYSLWAGEGDGAAAVAAGAPEAAGAAGPALRSLFISLPNGFWMDNFTPKTVGANFELRPSLKPFSSVQDDIMVLTGLAADNARSKGDGGGDHARSSGAFLTGVHPYKTSGRNIKLGVSVDQVMANTAGQNTHLPSLEVGCDNGRRAGDCDTGYSCAYVSNISWASETQPMPKLVDPALIFDRLFGTSAQGIDPVQQMKQRGSILDYTSGELKQLGTQVGAGDRRKLDEFTNSVREVERRIQREITHPLPKPPDGSPRPVGIPKDNQEHIRLIFDLLALAFHMDLTRVSTFMIASEGSNRAYPELGVPGGHHEMSHHAQSVEKIEAVKKIDLFHMKQLAYFLDKLKKTKDGDVSLLDRCMIMAGSGISDGDDHNHNNLPILCAGHGGGAWTPGRHVKYNREIPLCNLYVSMLNTMGVKTERFGDSTGALGQLKA